MINAVLALAPATLKKSENSFSWTISKKSKTHRKKLLKNHTTQTQQFSAQEKDCLQISHS
jgi:hypothetical protein